MTQCCRIQTLCLLFGDRYLNDIGWITPKQRCLQMHKPLSRLNRIFQILITCNCDSWGIKAIIWLIGVMISIPVTHRCLTVDG